MNCEATCPSVDSSTGWYLSARLACANQPGNTTRTGLWEATCGGYSEGLMAGQEYGRPHFLDFTVKKPSESDPGSISLRLQLLGDIWVMPNVVDQVKVAGVYYFDRPLLTAGTSPFSVGDGMELSCQSDSKVEIDRVSLDCSKFKALYFDPVTCQ